MQTITTPTTLDQVGTLVHLDENYTIEFPDTSYIVVVAGATYPKAGVRFSHPNVAARKDDVHYTRAYWPDGRKKWFNRAGIDFYFVVPKKNITLIPHKGYSYVKVEIDGEQSFFNISGGGAAQWNDRVGKFAHIGIGCKLQTLNRLAGVAWSVEECRENKVEFDIKRARDSDGFVNLIAGIECRKRLGPGHKIVLWDDYYFAHDRSRKEFEIENKCGRRRAYRVTADGYHARASYNSINWKTTALANGFALSEPVAENQLGKVTNG